MKTVYYKTVSSIDQQTSKIQPKNFKIGSFMSHSFRYFSFSQEPLASRKLCEGYNGVNIVSSCIFVHPILRMVEIFLVNYLWLTTLTQFKKKKKERFCRATEWIRQRKLTSNTLDSPRFFQLLYDALLRREKIK